MPPTRLALFSEDVTCPIGHGLLLTGEDRVPLRVVASPEEDALVTTDPAELAARQQQERAA